MVNKEEERICMIVRKLDFRKKWERLDNGSLEVATEGKVIVF